MHAGVDLRVERFATGARAAARLLWDAHAAAAPRATRLNHPGQVLLRYDLLTRLAAAGINRFRVFPADAPAAAEVFQRVDVEQRGRRLPSGERGLRRILPGPTGVEDVGRGEGGVAGGDADLPGVHDVHRQLHLEGRQLGGLEGAAHLAGEVHRHDLVDTLALERAVEVGEQGRRRT